jgi:hypothetical protein
MCSLDRYIPCRRWHHRVGATVTIIADLNVAAQLRSRPNDHAGANARRTAPASEVAHFSFHALRIGTRLAYRLVQIKT